MIFCPSCQSQVDASKDVCPTCGWKFVTSSAKLGPSIVRPATRPKIQCEVDLAATVDRTGSSQRFQAGIPLTYEMVVNQVKAKARAVKCWLGSHGDLDYGEEFVIHTDGGTPEQAVEDVKKITFGGGGDLPEHHIDGVESLLNRVPWTSDPSKARGAIIVFTTDDTKPARSGISPSALGKKIKDKGILLYLVCEVTPSLRELAEAAEGLIFPISNNPNPTDLQRIAAQLAASIVATVGSGGTVPMTVPA